MFNVTVLKIKDIFKFLIGMMLTILIIVVFAKNFHQKTNEEEKNETSLFSKNSMIECMEYTIPSMASINEENKKSEEEQTDKTDLLQLILQTQISSIKAIENSQLEGKTENTEEVAKEETSKTQETNQTQDTNQAEENQENTEVQLAKTGLQTQVITNNPISENANCQYGNVKIKNQTSYELTQDMLTPDIKIENKNIILFHTHSCESYTSSEKYSYTPTGTFRTTDLNFTVTRVGTELENQLKQYNYNVVHDTSYHDYPSYNGSYTRSLATVESILQTNPSDIIIDVHRDAVGSRSDYAPTVKIGDNDEAAQIMFVIRN